jgi:hypothetical protein
MKKGLLLFTLLPTLAAAEVMDKESSLVQLFAWCIISSIALFLSARHHPKYLPVVAALPACFVWGQLSEITDRFVGADILREAGPFYVQVSWALPWPMLTSLVLGLWLRFRAQPCAPADGLRPPLS